MCRHLTAAARADHRRRAERLLRGRIARRGRRGRVAQAISEHVKEHAADYDHIVATADWHVDPGDALRGWIRTTSTRGRSHCVAGSGGRGLPPAPRWRPGPRRGRLPQGRVLGCLQRVRGPRRRRRGARPSRTGCAERSVCHVDVVGIATDHCVRATALDARREGFDTTVLLDLTAGVARHTTEAALLEMDEAGIRLLGSPTVAS